VLLTGPRGVGKSTVLIEAIRRIERRKSERIQLDITQEMILPESELAHAERCKQRLLTLVYLRDTRPGDNLSPSQEGSCKPALSSRAPWSLPSRKQGLGLSFIHSRRYVAKPGRMG
jgi:hypothetical protein